MTRYMQTPTLTLATPEHDDCACGRSPSVVRSDIAYCTHCLPTPTQDEIHEVWMDAFEKCQAKTDEMFIRQLDNVDEGFDNYLKQFDDTFERHNTEIQAKASADRWLTITIGAALIAGCAVGWLTGGAW